MGVSVMQLVAPLVVSLSIFAVFGSQGVKQPDGTELYLANASWIWVPFLAIFTIAAWFGMNDLATSKASIKEQLPVLKRGRVDYEPAVSGNLRLLYRLLRGLCDAVKNAVPGCSDSAIRFLRAVYCALARSAGGALSDRLGGTRVTLVNFILMAIFSGLLFLTVPTDAAGRKLHGVLRGLPGAVPTAGLVVVPLSR